MNAAAGMVLCQMRKSSGNIEVIHGVDLDIIAGLEEVTDGEIAIGGGDVTDLDLFQRGIALVFQTYALYPHMSVRDNLGFGLKMVNTPKPEIDVGC